MEGAISPAGAMARSVPLNRVRISTCRYSNISNLRLATGSSSGCDGSITSGSRSGKRGRRQWCAPRHRLRAAAPALVQGGTGRVSPACSGCGESARRAVRPAVQRCHAAPPQALRRRGQARLRLQGARQRLPAAGTGQDLSAFTSSARTPGERPIVGEGMFASGSRMRSSGTGRSTSLPAHAKALRHIPVSHLAPTCGGGAGRSRHRRWVAARPIRSPSPGSVSSNPRVRSHGPETASPRPHGCRRGLPPSAAPERDDGLSRGGPWTGESIPDA